MSIMVFPYKVTNRQIIYFVSKYQDLQGGPFSIFCCELSPLVGSFNIDFYVRQLWTVCKGNIKAQFISDYLRMNMESVITE